jgi:hypothetical protein
VVFKSHLDEDDVHTITQSRDAVGLPTSLFNDELCLDVLSLLNKSLLVMPAATLKNLVTPQVRAPGFLSRLTDV